MLGAALPKARCIHVVSTFASRYLCREYFKARVYTIWAHRPSGFRTLSLRCSGAFRHGSDSFGFLKLLPEIEPGRESLYNLRYIAETWESESLGISGRFWGGIIMGYY